MPFDPENPPFAVFYFTSQIHARYPSPWSPLSRPKSRSRAFIHTLHAPPPTTHYPRLTTLSLPPSSASRSVNISPVLSSLRILPVATGVYHSSFPTSDFQTSRHAKSFVCIGLLPLCRLFALFSAFASFVFNRLEPLSTKHPGWRTPTLLRQASLPRHMRHVASLSPVPSFDCAYFPSPRGCTTPTGEGDTLCPGMTPTHAIIAPLNWVGRVHEADLRRSDRGLRGGHYLWAYRRASVQRAEPVQFYGLAKRGAGAVGAGYYRLRLCSTRRNDCDARRGEAAHGDTGAEGSEGRGDFADADAV